MPAQEKPAITIPGSSSAIQDHEVKEYETYQNGSFAIVNSMSNLEVPMSLSADKPLVDPKHDRLGYALFAEQLARSISALDSSEGLVIGIYGPWGAGKSTVLNFVRHYLAKSGKTLDPTIIEFNPWWFSGQENLVRRFFDHLTLTLAPGETEAKELLNMIKTFADTLEKIPTPENKWISWIRKCLTQFSDSAQEVTKLKADIDERLKNRDSKVVIFMDDIDRLAAEEIRQLFHLVKVVGNFPNVIYVIAFDRSVVATALESFQGTPGDEYLEKIIQVPFELPLPDRFALRKLLFDKLECILRTDQLPWDTIAQDNWTDMYYQVLDRFIKTPRDIVRLTNSLGVTFPAVRHEVNSVDFIAIEFLRVFEPSVYDIVRHNPDLFAGRPRTSDGSSTIQQEEETFHKAWLHELKEARRESVKALVQRLFPRLSTVWVNTRYRPEQGTPWKQGLRVCRPERFHVYFRLALPEGEPTNVEMNAIVALTANAELLASKLRSLSMQHRPDGTTRARVVLERLEDYTATQIPKENIPATVHALLLVGDELQLEEDRCLAMLDLGNIPRIKCLVYQLLLRLDPADRLNALRKAIDASPAVSISVYLVAMLGSGQDEAPVIDDQHHEEFQRVALAKIHYAANADLLLNTPDLAMVLYQWKDWADVGEVKQWIMELWDSDQSLLRVLAAFQIELWKLSADDSVKHLYDPLDSRSLLLEIADREVWVKRLRKITEMNKGLSEDERKLLDSTIKAMGVTEPRR